MYLGVDLDNTIAIYDDVFVKYADQLLGLKGYKNKVEVANYLRENNKGTDWTYLQGEVYGKYMLEAAVAEKFLEVITHPDLTNLQIEIVSHRTKKPTSGAGYDMHAIAIEWINENILSALSKKKNLSVFFFETFEEKLEFIASKKYTAFIDDLPDVLMSPIFPVCTKRILYKANSIADDFQESYSIMDSWENLQKLLK